MNDFNRFFVCAVLISTAVAAQEIGTEIPDNSKNVTDAGVVYSTVGMEGMGDTPVVVAPSTETDPGGRIRWGVSGNLGWHFPSSAFTFGIDGRVGYQISNIFSAYAIIGAAAGFGFGVTSSVRGASLSVTGISYLYLGGMAELMLGDLFFVGAGPVIAQGGYAGSSVGASGAGIAQVSNIASVGFKPGLDVRLGLQFGSKNPQTHRRGGFSLGLDVMTLLHPNSTITTFRADGPGGTAGAAINTTGLTVSVIPMLMLGYDAR
jgi:hypothetical protein